MSVGKAFVARPCEPTVGTELTPGFARHLTANALTQAHIVGQVFNEILIPSLGTVDRKLALDIARLLEAKRIFQCDLIRNLETLIKSLGDQIDEFTHVYWEGDENHVRGGYRSVFVEPKGRALVEAKGELVILRDAVLAALSAAHALQENTFQFE